MNCLEDHIISFVSRKESPDDVQKLKKWLSVDPARRDDLKQWLAVWDIAGIGNTVEKLNPDKTFQRFMLQM
jgi:hypothetical protein